MGTKSLLSSNFSAQSDFKHISLDQNVIKNAFFVFTEVRFNPIKGKSSSKLLLLYRFTDSQQLEGGCNTTGGLFVEFRDRIR